MKAWADETFAKILIKAYRGVPLAATAGIIPYKSADGQWAGAPFDGNSWWTGGFWPALQWQLYAATRDPLFMREARRAEAMLIEELCRFELLNHDMGFMYLISCGADHHLTGDTDMLRHTLHAAALLAGRYNPAGFIRAWNGAGREGWAIIDCMMNLPLLFFASRVTGDPRFAAIARRHADTTRKSFVREDGSCNHIVIFDPDTGKALDAPAGQGCFPGSSWSRGQAWALYGFTLVYCNTGLPRYLDTACRIADYFIAHIRQDGLTDCDFRQSEDVYKIDNIAGACAASGLLTLSGCVDKQRSAHYHGAACALLRALDTLCADWTDASPGILQQCTAAYNDDGAGTHINILYGDYFFTEAVAKLRGTDPELWLS
jgi:unsaturated chondroitin disaccharide hydrolase